MTDEDGEGHEGVSDEDVEADGEPAAKRPKLEEEAGEEDLMLGSIADSTDPFLRLQVRS